MAYNSKFTAEQVIEAIKGTGGIQTKIAEKLGCHRHTVRKYIEDYVTVRLAYEDECEQPLDISESIVLGNINILAELQKRTGEIVDSSDAKWYLTKKGKGRGYTERQEITGADGGSLDIRVIGGANLDDI